MIIALIAGILIATFSAWILTQAIPRMSHYRANLRSQGIGAPKILAAQVGVVGGWSLGVLIGLGLIAWYFMR